MAASFVNFAPSSTAVFSFQAQLAGAQYTISVPWNIFGQRYYISVADASGNVVLYAPLIASGPQLTSTFSWDDSGTATAVTSVPHNVPLGQVASIFVSQTDSGFDGSYSALATGPTTLTYALAADPGEATPLNGAVNLGVNNMIAGVIAGAYLLFRINQQFEYG